MMYGPRFLPFLRLPVYLVALLCGGGLATSMLAQSAGSLDQGFTLTHVLGDRVNTVSAETDGSIVFGGTISQVDGTASSIVARVKADGTLDSSFVPPAIESYNTLTDTTITQVNPDFIPVVFATAIQPNGKVLVGGSFYFINSKPGYGGLTRLNVDGSLDGSFKAPRFSGTVFAVMTLGNGNILVGGDFNFVDDKRRNCLVELTSTGKLVSSFTPGAFEGTLSSGDAVSSFPTVHTIAVQSDGKIVVGGIFTSIGGTRRRAIARLDRNGDVDTNFVPDAGFNPVSSTKGAATSIDQVLSVVVQGDGKLVLGGNFRDPTTGSPINSVYRLNANGALDPSFNPGGAGTAFTAPGFPNYDGIVDAVALEPDGKILLGGDFVAYNDVTTLLVTRLNTDGTLDTTFSVGSGPDNSVYSLALQSNGQLLAAGAFQTVDNVARPRVARFNTVAGVPPAVVVRIVAAAKRVPEIGLLKGAEGLFKVSRTGSNQTADLLVKYTVGGTARPGVDYTKLSGQVVIPGGSSSAVIKVKPRDVTHANKKVTVTLQPDAAYGVTPKPGASIILVAPGLIPFG